MSQNLSFIHLSTDLSPLLKKPAQKCAGFSFGYFVVNEVVPRRTKAGEGLPANTFRPPNESLPLDEGP
jgi:alpha/beta superfamily hydrolase